MGFQRGYILSLIALVHSTLLYAQCISAGGLCSLNIGSNGYEYPSYFSSEHQYDSLGFELERILSGGISQSFAYDNIGRLVDSKTRQSTKVRREITKNRMDINMKWWQIQFPEEETSSTPLAISPDGGKTLIDWMEAIESNRRFPFQYRLSPKMSLDDYIADDLGVPLFSEQVRNIIDELMTGEEGIEWYEVPVVQSRNQYRYFAPKFTRALDVLNEDSSLYGVNKSILIKAVLSTEKIKEYSIVPIVGSSEAFFFPTRIAISDRVKKALEKARVSGISFSPIKVD